MKILFFRIGAIGDTLLTTPAIDAVKKIFPGCEIHYFAGEKAAQILQNNPSIDKIFVFKEKNIKLVKFLRIFMMRKEFKEKFGNIVYDYFIDFESSYYSAYVSLFIKAKQKIGFKIKSKRRYIYNFLYNKRVDYSVKNKYLINRFLTLVSVLGGVKGHNKKPILSLSKEEKEKGKEFYLQNQIEEKDKRILLSGSATWASKKWPSHYWEELIFLINKNNTNCKIIVLWGPGDEEDIEILESKQFNNTYIIPKTELRELAAIVSHGDILISNDSGVRHIATALGLKTIGLFGPTNEKNWAFEDEKNITITDNIKCRPCNKTKSENNTCMKNITPEIVFNKLKKIL